MASHTIVVDRWAGRIARYSTHDVKMSYDWRRREIDAYIDGESYENKIPRGTSPRQRRAFVHLGRTPSAVTGGAVKRGQRCRLSASPPAPRNLRHHPERRNMNKKIEIPSSGQMHTAKSGESPQKQKAWYVVVRRELHTHLYTACNR